MRSALKISFVFILALTLASCISRLERPRLTGFIYDAKSKDPLAGVTVGETVTDNKGYYDLPELRYWSYFPFIFLEPAPVVVKEPIEKSGYRSTEIDIVNPSGGGVKRGKASHYPQLPIYLEPK